MNKQTSSCATSRAVETQTAKTTNRKLFLSKGGSAATALEGNLTSSEAQQVRTQPLSDFEGANVLETSAMELLATDEANFPEKNRLIDYIKSMKKPISVVSSPSIADEGSTQKQQILEELQVGLYYFLLYFFSPNFANQPLTFWLESRNG